MPKCTKCGKSFDTAQQLKVHRYFKHNGPNPFLKKPSKPGPKGKNASK